MSRTARRGLAPDAAGRALSHTVRPPRTRLPWSPAALEAELHTVLAAYEERAAVWREAFEDLDDDVLAEAAVEARAFSADPAAAVDELVCGLLGQLADWQLTIGELGCALTTRSTVGRCPTGPPTSAAPKTSATTTATCPPRPAATGRGDHHRPARGRADLRTDGGPGPGHPRSLRDVPALSQHPRDMLPPGKTGWDSPRTVPIRPSKTPETDTLRHR